MKKRLLAALAAALLIAFCVGFAVRSVFFQAVSDGAQGEPLTVEAQQGSLGLEQTLNATVTWEQTGAVASGSQGVLTWRADDSRSLNEGEAVVRVNEAPVILLQGVVPMYRDVSPGMSGEDVRQLQNALIRLGDYAGAADGQFSESFATAVVAFQTRTHQSATGTVPRGSVIFVPTVPARVQFAENAEFGAAIAVGQPLLHLMSSSPHFDIPVSPAQAALVTPQTTVKVTVGVKTWAARIASVGADDNQNPTLALTGADGQPCGTPCADLPFADHALVPTTVAFSPRTSGIVLPVSAIQSAADGATFVVTSAEGRVPVTVVTTSQGKAIVTGASAGTRIAVNPAESAAT
ncbi:peptidoglycan-binding protein [Micrococcales bacterium 31B]|nr:peptidoglycan-binding protein [Micrococcales bacterium 31B]